MTNIEYLESVKMEDRFFDDEDHYKYRKVKALEIIAEELVRCTEDARIAITVLENIETALNRR